MKNKSQKYHHVIDEDKLKVTIIFKDMEKLIANATISIHTTEYGFMTIKGFQIWKSPQQNDRLQEPINITPPSQQIYGKYVHLLFIENDEKWYELESRIYDALSLARGQRKNNDSESVNPNEIPL